MPRDENHSPDIRAGRLKATDYIENFSDLHDPLSTHEAYVEADRCYFCYDAPCINACPTGIDIPLFIRQIHTSNPIGSAKTILDANIMGGMCARVCPTETLCEEACVRELAEGKPVKIGQLQRYATDTLMEVTTGHPFERATETGKHIAVVGAGPAGLSCAHRLAMKGHTVTIFEARPKPGGLNEYGIASYKATDGFAQKEVDFILAIGGITIEYDKALGKDVTLEGLKDDHDAVFLGMGLSGVNGLGIEGVELDGTEDAVAFIERLRQTEDLSTLPVGRRVVVIGGGMTAIDAATQAKLLGAEDVTIVYRRGKDAMNASAYEQDVAQTQGVKIKHWAQPNTIRGEEGVSSITFEYTALNDGKLAGTGETFTLDADMVLAAIGQSFEPSALADGLALERGRIKTTEDRRTSDPKVWAGGDCIVGGEDLTVVSVEDGKIAAENIHNVLSA